MKICILLLLLISLFLVNSAYAQTTTLPVPVSNSIPSTPTEAITIPTPPIGNNEALEKRISAIEAENRLVTRIEWLINIFSSFATLLLAFGAYSIYKSDRAQKEAEQGVKKIKEMVEESVELQIKHKDLLAKVEEVRENLTTKKTADSENIKAALAALDEILNEADDLSKYRNDFFHSKLRHINRPETRAETEMRHEADLEAAQWRVKKDKEIREKNRKKDS